MPKLAFPLAKSVFVTTDSFSFRVRDLRTETELPLASHPGAFGVVRKNHVHEGVDLYGLPGDEVIAMEAGVVVGIGPFTGKAAGSPWWGETQYLLVEGNSGVFNYGEIVARDGLEVGQLVQQGEVLGHLERVLLNDKGRPTTMLHVELYAPKTKAPVTSWALDAPKPQELLNPTELLIHAALSQEVELPVTHL